MASAFTASARSIRLRRLRFPAVAGFLIGIFLLLRLLSLISAVEQTFHWEELYRGTIAKEFLSGLKMPLLDYQADDYSGGSLVTGILAAAFFKIAGPSLFALKCVPLSFFFGTLLLTLLFLKKSFGPKPAIIAALFFVFGPPSFAQASLTAMGYHSESIFFSILIFWVFYRFQEQGRSLLLFLFGFASGLGIWFTPVTFLTTLSCLSAWVLFERKKFGFSRALLLLGGLSAGFLPGWIFGGYRPFAALSFIQQLFWVPADAGPGTAHFEWMKLPRLLAKGLPLSFGFRDLGPLPGWILCYLYAALGFFVLASSFFGRKLWREKSVFPFLVYACLFFTAYGFSRIPPDNLTSGEPFYSFFEYRYFMPLHFVLILLLSIVIASAKTWMRVLGMLLLFLGGLGQSSLFFQEPWARAAAYQGYSYFAFGVHLEQKFPYPENLKKMIEISKWAAPYERKALGRGFFGWGLDLRSWKAKGGSLEPLPGMSSSMRLTFAEGAGHSLDLKDPVEQAWASKLWTHLKPEEQSRFCFGIVSKNRQDLFHPSCSHWEPFFAGVDGRRLNSLNPEEIRWFERGRGSGTAMRWIFQRRRPNFLSDTSDYFWGMGWEIGREMGEDLERAGDWMGRIPPQHQKFVQEGFQEALEFFWE